MNDLERLRARIDLGQRADEALETALRQRLTIEASLQLVFPLLGSAIGAQAALVRTFDEALEQRDFGWCCAPPERLERLRTAVEAGEALASATLIARPLDVAGESVGIAALLFDPPLDEAGQHSAAELLGQWCEELDNHLAAAATARRKHLVTRAIAAALTTRVLADGITAAIEVLREAVSFDDLLLVYRHEDADTDRLLSYRVIKQGELLCDSSTGDDDPALRSWARGLLAGELGPSVERFGLQHYRDQALITGVRSQRLIGRLVVARAAGEFNLFDRDLLERFSDHLRQRIVDFNREYKQLSLCFSPRTVRRLLAEPDYEARYLRPQEREVAVMFCDIAGFTRVSEQVLREPRLIGKLIDVWSRRVVEIIWETDGVFDKIVGDCVIGLWGPPLFEVEGRVACARAVAAARSIRDFTAELGGSGLIAELGALAEPLGVATGLNYCRLLVGQIGPNNDYTGFSSGMNETARLQGVAVRDEVLCLNSFVEAVGDAAQFGPEQQAQVKNVARPLVYRPLL